MTRKEYDEQLLNLLVHSIDRTMIDVAGTTDDRRAKQDALIEAERKVLQDMDKNLNYQQRHDDFLIRLALVSGE